jgi:hypothetical protein
MSATHDPRKRIKRCEKEIDLNVSDDDDDDDEDEKSDSSTDSETRRSAQPARHSAPDSSAHDEVFSSDSDDDSGCSSEEGVYGCGECTMPIDDRSSAIRCRECGIW